MPNEPAGGPGNRESTIADLAEAAGPGSVDRRHLLLVGAGPGLGLAVARRFAVGGYRVTLVARSTDGLRDLAGTFADTGAKINTIAADASDPDRLGARMRELYSGDGAPGVIVYNAVMALPTGCCSSRMSPTSRRRIQSMSSAPSSSRRWPPRPCGPPASGPSSSPGAGSPTTRSRPLRPFRSARRLSGRPRQCSALTWNRTASVGHTDDRGDDSRRYFL